MQRGAGIAVRPGNKQQLAGTREVSREQQETLRYRALAQAAQSSCGVALPADLQKPQPCWGAVGVEHASSSIPFQVELNHT